MEDSVPVITIKYRIREMNFCAMNYLDHYSTLNSLFRIRIFFPYQSYETAVLSKDIKRAWNKYHKAQASQEAHSNHGLR